MWCISISRGWIFLCRRPPPPPPLPLPLLAPDPTVCKTDAAQHLLSRTLSKAPHSPSASRRRTTPMCSSRLFPRRRFRMRGSRRRRGGRGRGGVGRRGAGRELGLSLSLGVWTRGRMVPSWCRRTYQFLRILPLILSQLLYRYRRNPRNNFLQARAQTEERARRVLRRRRLHHGGLRRRNFRQLLESIDRLPRYLERL